MTTAEFIARHPKRIIRVKELALMLGMSRSGIDKLRERDPTFPRAIPLSNFTGRTAPIGFLLSDVENWIDQRAALAGVEQ